MSVSTAFFSTRSTAGARLGPAHVLRRRVIVRADPDEEEFEARLARLNKSKVPTGVSRKDLRKTGTALTGYAYRYTDSEFASKKAPIKVSYEDESMFHFQHAREHAEEESNIGYHEVAKVDGVNRGFGAWGDMVITLDGGDKLELRSVAGWQEVRDYIMERRDAIRGKDLSQEELLEGKTPSKGFSS